MGDVAYFKECRRRFVEVTDYLREKELVGILKVDYIAITPYNEDRIHYYESGIHIWTTSIDYYHAILCPAIAHICCKNKMSLRVSQKLDDEEPGKSRGDVYIYTLITSFKRTSFKSRRITRVPGLDDVEEVTAFLREAQDVRWGEESGC